MLRIDIDRPFLELIMKKTQGAQSFSPKNYKILVIYNPLEEDIDDFVPKVLKERFPKYEIRLQPDLVLDREEIKIGLISKRYNKNHGCGTTFDDLIEMADKIDMSRREEASKYLDNLLEKKKRDIDDPKEIMESYKRGETPEFVRKQLDMKEE